MTLTQRESACIASIQTTQGSDFMVHCTVHTHTSLPTLYSTMCYCAYAQNLQPHLRNVRQRQSCSLAVGCIYRLGLLDKFAA